MTDAYIKIITLLEQIDHPIEFTYPDGTPYTIDTTPGSRDMLVIILRGLAELLEPNPPEATQPDRNEPLEGYEI